MTPMAVYPSQPLRVNLPLFRVPVLKMLERPVFWLTRVIDDPLTALTTAACPYPDRPLKLMTSPGLR
jgi:hypothetical protein